MDCEFLEKKVWDKYLITKLYKKTEQMSRNKNRLKKHEEKKMKDNKRREEEAPVWK